MDVSSVVRAARARAGLTQAELARRTGTSQAAISALERGVEQPTVDRLERILRATGRQLGVESIAPAGVEADDLALLRHNLTLTPEQRLRQVTNRMRLRGLARR